MTINTIEEANQILAQYIPQVREMLGKDITLDRMIPLMSLLGNPQDKLKIIHVAGTSGKTSTAYYIASLLKQAGKQVGLTVSPHIDSVMERVQIDLQPLSEKEFCVRLSEFMDIIQKIQSPPTYFELLMAFAYWYFAKTNVDYAVIETGLGGLHDASNVAVREDKVCVITDIGHDHMHILGHTLAEITAQKAGIIHNGNRVFMYTQSDEVNGVVQAHSEKYHAILNMLSEKVEHERAGSFPALDSLAEYQQRNWLLARGVYGYVSKRDALPELSDKNLAASIQIQVPGRMEILTIKNKTLIMDGAHNEQKMQAFVNSFKSLCPGKTAAIVLALKLGKEYEAVLPLLLPICSRLILTTFDALQDLPSKSISPELLARVADDYGFATTSTVFNPLQAYGQLINSPEETLIITGSFYLLSCIRPAIMASND